MPRTVDLSSQLNRDVLRGHPADFPIAVRPVHWRDENGASREIPKRVAVVREDTGRVLSVVSDRYTLVPHQSVLETLERAVSTLDCGPVPKGIYVDRQGARMRALFKFPGLSREFAPSDPICPCVKVVNTYDGTSRIQVSIGAFRFVCTNLAVGGGGVFAGGFMAVHAGEIPVEKAGEQLSDFLGDFPAIIRTYRAWMGMLCGEEPLREALKPISRYHQQRLWLRIGLPLSTVFAAYNAATAYATHETRSAAVAFGLLTAINRGFQSEFAVG